MSASRYSTLVYAVLVFVVFLFAIFLLMGCSEDNPVTGTTGNNGEDPYPPPETIPDTAIVSIRLVSWNDLSGQSRMSETPGDVDEVRFEISALDIQIQSRTVQAGQALIEETFEIATGVARQITIQAFNADDSLIYIGTKYTDIADSLLVTGVGMVLSTDNTPPVYTGLDDAVAISDNHVLISWQLATDGSDPDLEAIYLIYMSTVSGSFDFSSPSYTGEPGETSCLIAGLDPATTYYFVVRAMDRAGNIDLNTSQQSITTPGAGSELYVDVNTGSDNSGCGTSNSPCRTITYALSKSLSDQTIHVAKGTYNDASGETFPLQLKPGTTLLGEGYWWNGVKVIKETYIEGTTPMILGADDASIISCYLKPTGWGSNARAIDDAGHSITVFHCTIDGTLAPGLQGIAFFGGSSLIDSRVENFSGGGGRAIEVWGTGNALINDNVVVNNSHGINVVASNSDINNNWVEDIYSSGINIGYSDSLTTGVTVFRNTVSNVGVDGISIISATDTRIVRNSISYSAGYGISIWNYQQPTNMVVVIHNSITEGSSVGIHLLHGGAIISCNNIACNVGGVFVRSGQVIDLRENAWDHNPPTINDGRGATDPGCDGIYDICYEADYAHTPEPLYIPCYFRGSCIIGVLPSSPWAPTR